MVTGRGFHTEEQGCSAPRRQLQYELIKAFPVHRTGEGEYFLPLIANTARIKLLFRHIDTHIERHIRTSSNVAEKQGLPPANPPRSQGLFMAQSTYHGSK